MIKTIAQFRREVERQVRDRAGRCEIAWEVSERITYPTGMKGMRGVFVVTQADESQRFMALYDMPKGEGHLLEVRAIK